MSDNLPAVPNGDDLEVTDAEIVEDDWDDEDRPDIDADDPDDDGSVAAAAAKVARLTAEIEHLTAEVARDDSEPGQALVPVTSSVPAVAFKAQLAKTRSKLVRSQQQLVSATEELKHRAEMAQREAEKMLQPLMDHVRRLEDMIVTINLYLGRDHHIVPLVDCEQAAAAPADTPITLRQMVLAMDEECGLNPEDEGIDVDSIEQFDAWLTSDPAHLAQVLPEPKGVVVLIPRRSEKDYGDPWRNAHMSDANKQSYWLIRNGDKLWRMHTDYEVGDRLIPLADEFTGFFVTKERVGGFGSTEYREVTLEPGSRQWLEAEKSADARRRHYMKMALILQGLVDLSTVFAPLPAEDVSFLRGESYTSGHVRLIADAENTIGDGHEPFYDWLARLNARLSPGMRIVGAFDGNDFYRMNHGTGGYDSSDRRIRPKGASYPQTGVLYTLEKRNARQTGFTFKYQRTDEIWVRGSWENNYRDEVRPPKTRATCEVLVSDKFILPYDLVTIEDMERYLTSRTDRHAYKHLIPLLHAAIEAKHAERAEEEPFRLLLAGVIAKNHNVSVEDAMGALPELVDWWKLANKWHRPLVAGDPKLEARATRMISAEFAARRAARERGESESRSEAAALTHLQTAYPDTVLIARKRDGSYIVYTPENDDNVFVAQHTLRAPGAKVTTKRWVLPGAGWRKWTTLAAADRWDQWDHSASLSDHLTGPEMDTAVADLRALFDGHEAGPVMVITYLAKNQWMSERGFRVYVRGTTATRLPDPTRPLTGKAHARFHTAVAYFGWKRTTGRRVVLDDEVHLRDQEWKGYKNSRDDRPWLNKGAETAVWTDPDAIAAVEAEFVPVVAAESHAEALRERLNTTMFALRQAWVADQERRAYERFLEDYQDPDLWDGHKATLRFNYPYHQEDDTLTHVVARLIEDGVDFDGKTAADALDLYRSVHGEPDGDTPEDLLPLVLVDRDDDDEDD